MPLTLQDPNKNFLRNTIGSGFLAMMVATGTAAQAQEAMQQPKTTTSADPIDPNKAKVGVELTVTTGGVVPTLTFSKPTSDTTQVGGAIGVSPTQKDVIGVLGVAPTPESAMAIYGGFGKTTKYGETYNASGVGMKFNRAITGSWFDALGFGLDNKYVKGATLRNTSTTTISGYQTTTTSIITQQPNTNISRVTVGGVKYTEDGAWTMDIGPSSLNGKTGGYVGVNYFSNSGSSAGLSIQHGAVMANAGIDVSGTIANTLNTIFGTKYSTNPSRQGDKLSLPDVTVQHAMNSGRLVGLSSLMPDPTTITNRTVTSDTTKPFVVDATNMVQNPDGSISITIVPSLHQAGVNTLPSTMAIDLSTILPPGVSIQSITAASANSTVTAGFVSGTSQFTVNVSNGAPPVNPYITIVGTDGNTYKMIIKTMRGQ